MRAILILLAMLSVAASPAVEQETLRARAALALAFASPKPTYAVSFRRP